MSNKETERKVSVDVPRHFTDGKTEIGGGVQEVEISTAKRWAGEGKARILDPTVHQSKNAPETDAPPVVEAAKK